MKAKKFLPEIFLICLFFGNISFATPPFMWYGTLSIELYSGNGCSSDYNLNNCHEEADAFDNAVQNHADVIEGEMFYVKRRDAAVTASVWTGNYAAINSVDFLFYSGHGCGWGPFLGCNSTYALDILTSLSLYGDDGGYLKWVQASCCMWFCAPQYADGIGEFARWTNSFRGVHTVQGHRAATYDVVNTDIAPEMFWDLWVDNGSTIYLSWRNSQIYAIYTVSGGAGLQPATMAANNNYAAETYAAAQDVAAPNSATWLGYATVGTPVYGTSK